MPFNGRESTFVFPRERAFKGRRRECGDHSRHGVFEPLAAVRGGEPLPVLAERTLHGEKVLDVERRRREERIDWTRVVVGKTISTRISCDSTRSTSQASSSSAPGGGGGSGGSTSDVHHAHHHPQRGDEVKTDAVKTQQDRSLNSVDEEELVEEHKRDMLRNSYVDAPFRVQTNSTAETIDVMTSKRVEASSPSKSRLSKSRTSEDNKNGANLKAIGQQRRQMNAIAKVSAQDVTAIVLAGGVGEMNH